MDMKKIKVVSWNVNGIQNPVKRFKILSHLKSLNCDIAMLQETHISKEESLKLKQRWVGQIFFSPGTNASKGVCILISKKISFIVSDVCKDKEGRWVMVSGELQNSRITLMNLYAPNTAQASFLSSVNVVLSQFKNTPLLVGGDFNLVNSALMDRSSTSLPTDKSLSSAFKELLETQSVSDIWRLLNAKAREYTFYSKTHNSYSRIDYLLLSNFLIGNVSDATIHNLVISDHAPISITFNLSSQKKFKPKQWSFNNSLLKDDTFVTGIIKNIQEFIKINMTGTISISIIWEAFKATCRGWIISYASHKKKETFRRKIEILSKLKDLEVKHMSDPGNISFKHELFLVRAKAHEMIQKESFFSLYKLRKTYYEEGEKAGKMLAYQLKKLEYKHSISVLKDSNGKIISDEESINNIFRKYFISLYKSEYKANYQDLNNFFSDITLPKLREDSKEKLELPISEEEILNTIKSLANNKAPGNDGYTAEFYKCFSKELMPLLICLYNQAVEEESMPPTMRTAIISLLPKPGKDHLDVGNFRPISLLNNDYKIFAKMLAKRLEGVVTKLIHVDQVGFIQGRLLADNMRRLLQIMQKASSLSDPVVGISLDAEKAFDRIEWPFLFETLSRYGFGLRCLKWIRALYQKPVAAIKSNGMISVPFELGRSTRQGCPLSPLLFILALEPLACKIRQEKDITGISINGHDFKLNMYADDILLTLSKPSNSIPRILETIKAFGSFSGYRINWTKSEAIPLNKFTHVNNLGPTPFVWRSEGMKYLGIKIRVPIKEIFDLNSKPLLDSIKEDLKRWSALPMSIWGRAETLKMNVLPRLIFLVSSIPLPIRKAWFDNINTIFSRFLWNNKKPRINRNKLYQPRDKGGLGIPDVYLYYLAFNAKYSLMWGYKTSRDSGSWDWLEEYLVKEKNKSMSLSSLWYTPVLPKKTDNFIIKFSCDISKEIHKRLDIAGSILPSSPIWYNNVFKASGNPLLNIVWYKHNIREISQIVENQEIVSFEELRERYHLNQNMFLQYFQLKSIIAKFPKEYFNYKYDTDKKLKSLSTNRGTVSGLYKWLLLSSPNRNSKTESQWEHDLGVTLTPTEWGNIWSNINIISKSVRLRVIQLKILHRAYITPSRLKKIDPHTSNLCWHKCGQDGNLFHMLWLCPAVELFWTDVCKLISVIIKVNLVPCPLMCLLGLRNIQIKTRSERKIIGLAFLIVKRMILCNWKIRKPNCFSIETWFSEFLHILGMEQVKQIKDIKESETIWKHVLGQIQLS